MLCGFICRGLSHGKPCQNVTKKWFMSRTVQSCYMLWGLQSGCYAQSPIILYLKGCNNNASEAFFQVRSDKPSYKHNPKKSSVQSIFVSAMHVNKTYLVWSMYWKIALLSTLPIPHQSEAAFLGEHSFSESWALHASVSFSPLTLPPHFSFLLSSQLSRQTCAEMPAT